MRNKPSSIYPFLGLYMKLCFAYKVVGRHINKIMKKEIELIKEILLKTENSEKNLNGNFEINYKEINTDFSFMDLIKLSEKDFEVMSYINSDTTENYSHKIIKIKNNLTIEFNKFILTTYLESIT